MRFTDLQDEEQLWPFMTEPTEKLITCLARLDEPIMVLGGSGKMGKELIGTIQRADQENGRTRDVSVASTFSNEQDFELIESLGVHCFKGDLSKTAFLNSLPNTPFVVYMMGFKFGSSRD